MVAPVNRRPGHSRRAQYGTFFGYLLAIGGLGIGVLLLAGGSDDGSAARAARNGAADVTAPAAELAAAGRSEGQGFLAVIGGYLTRFFLVVGGFAALLAAFAVWAVLSKKLALHRLVFVLVLGLGLLYAALVLAVVSGANYCYDFYRNTRKQAG